MRRFALLALAAAAAGAGCSSPVVAKVTPSLSTAPRSYFVRIAEGLTAATTTEPMRVAPRMFSAYQLESACQFPARIARLEAVTRNVAFDIGDALLLSNLRVVAVNDSNVAVPNVAVVIEAEDLNPPVLELRSDSPDLNDARLRTVRSGTFHIRVRTLCSATNAELTITGQVRPPLEPAAPTAAPRTPTAPAPAGPPPFPRR